MFSCLRRSDRRESDGMGQSCVACPYVKTCWKGENTPGCPQKFFHGRGQRRHIAYLFQVADVAMRMDVHKTLYCFYEVCGTGTQISGSGSRHLNFLAPAPTSKSFWLRLQNDLVHQRRKTIVLFVKLAWPGTPERGCITGALSPLPFERGATGAQVPSHTNTISPVTSWFIKINLKEIYCSYSRTHKTQNGFLLFLLLVLRSTLLPNM